MGELESKRVRAERRVCPDRGTQRNATALAREHATRLHGNNRKGAAMSKIYTIALLIVSMALANTLGAEESAVTPDTPAQEPAAIPDPSLIPAPTGEGLTGERIRLLADFNGDGREDLALSDDEIEFSNAGIRFDLYLSVGPGKYSPNAMSFFAHPMAIAIEKCRDRTRIWTYYRSDASEGALGYQELKGHTLSDFVFIHIITGTEYSAMGNAMYQAVFRNSDYPIRADGSTTVDGVVQWETFYTNQNEEKSDKAAESGPSK